MRILDFKIFNNCLTTLKQTSKTAKVYMVESKIKAVDFDKVKENYCSLCSCPDNMPKSVDAVIENKDRIVFIEFKSGKLNKELGNLKHKIKDSLLIFCDITNKNISFTRENVDFILVFDKEKNKDSFRDISDHFIEKSANKNIYFGLHAFKSLYFKNVYTFDVEEFLGYIKE